MGYYIDLGKITIKDYQKKLESACLPPSRMVLKEKLGERFMQGAHSIYPKVVVQWLNQALCFYHSFCLVDSEVIRNRPLRVAAKRCSHIKKTPAANSNIILT